MAIRNLCSGEHAPRFTLILYLALLTGCAGPSAPDDAEARAVIERFVEQLRTGEVDAAWESTTADFKSDEGREAFRAYVQQHDVLRNPLEFLELKQVEVHGLTRWEGLLHPPAHQNGSSVTVRTMIANEAGVWKVERIEVE